MYIFLMSCGMCFLALDMSHNCISTIPDDIAACSSLQAVDFSWNSFAAFPNSLYTCSGLKYIDISHNHIQGEHE